MTANNNWIKTLANVVAKCDYYKEKSEFLELRKATEQTFEKLPLLDKHTLRSKEDQFINSDYKKESLTKDFTSGSTGIPIICYKSKTETAFLSLKLHQTRIRFHPKTSYARMIEFLPLNLPISYEKEGENEKIILSSIFNNEKLLNLYWKEIIKLHRLHLVGQ